MDRYGTMGVRIGVSWRQRKIIIELLVNMNINIDII